MKYLVCALKQLTVLLLWSLRIAVMLFALQYSTLPIGDQWTAVGVITRTQQFDYVTWEINALAAKLGETLYGTAPYLSEEARSGFVRAYFADLERARGLENRITTMYADPTVEDAEAQSADLRAERDALRTSLQARQTLTEATLEGQVAAVLVEQGFGTAGQLLPPISMRFTQVPNLLIVSPRDAIRFDISINLDPMPIDQIAALEDQIDTEQDVSSLIVPLGGIALYPAMILETTSLEFAIETFAHEWLHHYLFAFPLGLNYDFAGEARIINETTANLFGKAIAPLVLRRYYPDLARPQVTPTPAASASSTAEAVAPTPDPGQPPPFDFGAAMDETRTTVDQLLADGRIEDAETYMEARRRLFVENGYGVRKLNQAYFAFYGGYQSGTPGAGGQDPIGPAVRAIRDSSSSIQGWIVTMRDIVSRDHLLVVSDFSSNP